MLQNFAFWGVFDRTFIISNAYLARSQDLTLTRHLKMGGSKRKHNASATVFTAPKKEDCTYYEVARDKLIADLAAAVKAGDVRGMMKITYFVDGLPLFGFSKLHEMISTNDTYIENYDRAMKPYDTWRANIKAGDNVDTLREEESIWYDTRVLEIDHKKDTMKVHYLGWDSKYDEQLSVSGTVVIPQNTFSVGKKKPVRVRQIEEKLPAETDLNVAAVPPIDGEELKEVEGASSGELGRGSRRRASSSAAAGAVEGGEEAETGAGEGEKKDRESKPKEEKDLNDWICGICGWLEAEDGSDLVLCEGIYTFPT